MKTWHPLPWNLKVFESLPQLLEHVSNLTGKGMKINEKYNMTPSWEPYFGNMRLLNAAT